MMCSKTIEIASYDDLCKIGKDDAYPLDASYVQTCDIDASESRLLTKGFEPIERSEWTNIISFSGKYDGNGFSIKGLYINYENSASVGMFASLQENAIITDLHLAGAYVKGSLAVGGIAGCNHGTITRCSFNGNVEGQRECGGLVGYNTGDINKCTVLGNVEGEREIGGIAGFLFGDYPSAFFISSEDEGFFLVADADKRGSINDCKMMAHVSGHDCIGGICGTCISGNIFSCVVDSVPNDWNSVDGVKNVGGICGTTINGIITHSDVKIDVCGDQYVGGVVGSCESTFGRLVVISRTKYSGDNDNGSLLGFYGDVRAFTTRDVLEKIQEYCEIRKVTLEDILYHY